MTSTPLADPATANADTSVESPAPDFALEQTPVISARISTDGFAASWRHCQLIADFTAGFASSNFFDAQRHANILSSFLNELIELAFHRHKPAANLLVEVFKQGEALLLCLTVPAGPDLQSEYLSIFHQVRDEGSMAYLRASFRGQPDDPTTSPTSLIEMVRVYGLNLDIQASRNAQTVHITVPINFEKNRGAA